MPIFTQLVTNNLSLGDTQAYVMSLFPEDSPLGLLSLFLLTGVRLKLARADVWHWKTEAEQNDPCSV